MSKRKRRVKTEEKKTDLNQEGKVPEESKTGNVQKENEIEEISEAAAKSSRFSWKKFGLIFGGSILGLLFVVYISGMIYLKDKFLMNTTINGIDASFNTVEEIESKISDMVGNYSIELEERDKDRETITADQIGYHYVSKGEVEGFKKQQKLYEWPIAIWRNSEYYFESSTTFDEKMLYKTIDDLKCFSKKVVVNPTDAYMKFNGTTYEMVKETQGKKVLKYKLKEVLEASISKSDRLVSLEKTDCYAKPGVSEDDKVLKRTIRNMNRFAEVRIVYNFGENKEILDGSIISKWLSYDSLGKVTLDDERIGLYVDYLAERYDTYDRPRELKTHDGSTVTVKGGKYGWLLDREAEVAQLTDLIYQGAKVESRDPVYAQTAVSRENSDLGHDYVEVDLTNQHLWMYVGGQEVVSTDLVSGTYVNSGRRTPPGTYTLYYKKSPAVLKSDAPGDSYESPVTYWMPFNGGIGLHDANWRGSFGGDIYMYSGSHGCVNLPTSAASVIYENIYKGMPIICYYR